MQELSDCQASQVTNYLLCTLGNFDTAVLLQYVPLLSLQTHVQVALASSEAKDVEKLAEEANQILDFLSQPSAPLTCTISAGGTSVDVKEEYPDGPEVHLMSRHLFHQPSHQRTSSPTTFSCYHHRFDFSTCQCKLPCAWKSGTGALPPTADECLGGLPHPSRNHGSLDWTDLPHQHRSRGFCCACVFVPSPCCTFSAPSPSSSADSASPTPEYPILHIGNGTAHQDIWTHATQTATGSVLFHSLTSSS